MSLFKIVIEIQTIPTNTDSLVIVNDDNSPLFNFNFYNSGDAAPSNGVVISTDLVATTFNLRAAFYQIYNLQGLYNVFTDGVTIEIVGDFIAIPKEGGASTSKINTTYSAEIEALSITSTTFQKNNANNCGKVDIEIVTNLDIVEITEWPGTVVFSPNVTVATGTVNVITSIPRNYSTQITVKDSSDRTSVINISTPPFLNEGVIDINKTNNSILVTSSQTDLTLSYSITGSDYSSANVFTNLIAGNYTLYVKDEFDCIVEVDFEITESNVLGLQDFTPEFHYSNANPILMHNVESVDDDNILSNRLNRASCGDLDSVLYRENQKFRSWDIIKQQIKSGFDDLRVYTTDIGIDLPLTKTTNNIGIKVALDAKVFDLGGSKSGIYFVGGNTYNYDLISQIEATHSLNGELPSWVKVGGIVTINSFNYSIESISEDFSINAKYFVISRVYDTDTLIIKTIYNLFNYEVYEFYIPFKGKTSFNLEIFYDGEVKKTSELIEVNDIDPLYLIKSYCDYNTDMYFSSGIKPFIRVELDGGYKPVVKNNNDEYFTDEDSIQVDFDNYEVDRYKFLPVTKSMGRKIVLFLSHPIVYINGIKYRRESIDIENLGNSNLVVISADMLVKKQDKYKKDYELFLSSSSILSSTSIKNNAIIEL